MGRARGQRMIGEQVGPYLVESELGAGGMGTVYLAEVTSDAPGTKAGEKVALKVVHPHLLATPGFFKRFLREAELGKKVKHENVVRTFDVDATLVNDKQVNYMAMEYVEGRSLRQLANDLGVVPEALLHEIAAQSAAGLAAIHACDIVHRDLKPENVLITGDHQVRIMDLGVAKLQEASIAITKEGQFAGSLLYAAPEQFNQHEVGPLADLYSLGVMLYELGAGKNPFRRDDAAAVISAHLNADAPRASDVNTDLSTFFAEVLAGLLQKELGARIPSAEFLCTLLEEGERSTWWAEREQALRKTVRTLPKIRVRRDTELHGREAALEQLQRAWKRAQNGEGNTVLIDGEPGIGKTRLVDAFLHTLGDEEVHLLYGSYPPSGGIGGISDAIVGKFGSAGLENSLRPYMQETPSLVPAFAALAKHESPPTGSEPLQGDALHAVSCNLARALAAERPTIWIVDELHFAPAESRNLVLSLARAVDEHRILLVITTRPGLPEDELAHLHTLENFRRITLNRLSPREVIELVRDALQSEVLANSLGAQIAYKSDGVPLFAFEIIRGLKESEFLKVQEDGTYVQSRPIEDITVPSAIKDLVEGRLKDLSQEERAILDVGAILGFEFDPDLVARVRDTKRVQVLETLAAIERRTGIVRAKGRSYVFDHQQVQEVLHAALSEVLREEYHTMLAEAFVERDDLTPEDADGEEAFFVARHHLYGGRPKRALPYLDGALSYLERAYQNDAAIDLAQRALGVRRLLKGKERVEALLRTAALLSSLGRREEEGLAVAEAVEAADELGDAGTRVRTQVAMGMHMWVKGDNEIALKHMERAEELAAPLDDPALEVSVQHGLGAATSYLGMHDRALRHFETERDVARKTGNRMAEASASGALGFVSWLIGRYGDRKKHHEASLATASGSDSRAREAMSAHNLGNVCCDLGAPDEAGLHQLKALTIAREIGERRTEGLGAFGLGEGAERSGDPSTAVTHFREALRVFREIGHRPMEMDALVALGRLHARSGATALALESLEPAIDVSRKLGLHGKVMLASAWCAHIGGAPADKAESLLAEHESNMPFHERMEGRFVLWRATSKPEHLAEAHRLLCELREHSPEEYRESMIENVPLNRDIMAAWEQHGG